MIRLSVPACIALYELYAQAKMRAFREILSGNIGEIRYVDDKGNATTEVPESLWNSEVKEDV